VWWTWQSLIHAFASWNISGEFANGCKVLLNMTFEHGSPPLHQISEDKKSLEHLTGFARNMQLPSHRANS
jgi:hypothetical protein